MKFDDGSYLAIEVVYTHAPDREVHELYGEDMVDIRLEELDEIHDDAVFNRWVQADGVWDLFLAEVEPAQRRARWEARQKEFDVKDEQEHMREVEQRISKCWEEFGFPYGGDKTTVNDLGEIDAWFVEELAKRELRKSIQDAIDANVKRFGEALDRGVDDFSSPEEVDKFYTDHFKELIEQQKAAKREAAEKLKNDIKAAKQALEKELDIRIRKQFKTMAEFQTYAENKRQEKEKQRLKETLAPLISTLEEELEIQVDQEFSSRKEFEKFRNKCYAERDEQNNQNDLEAKVQAYMDEVVADVRAEYDVFVQDLADEVIRPQDARRFFDQHRRKIKDCISMHFEVDTKYSRKYGFHICRYPAKSASTSHLSELVSKVCTKVTDHSCNRYESTAAKTLLAELELDFINMMPRRGRYGNHGPTTPLLDDYQPLNPFHSSNNGCLRKPESYSPPIGKLLRIQRLKSGTRKQYRMLKKCSVCVRISKRCSTLSQKSTRLG